MHLLLSGEFPFDHSDRSVLEELIIQADLSTLRCCQDDTSAEEGNECDDQLHSDDNKATRKRREHTIKNAWRRVSMDGRDLLLGLLESRPRKRLTARAALEHPWFSGGGVPLVDLDSEGEGENGDIGLEIDDLDPHSYDVDVGNSKDEDDIANSSRSTSASRRLSHSSGLPREIIAENAKLLWHVHERLDRLIQQTRLPTLSFSAGSFLVGGHSSGSGVEGTCGAAKDTLNALVFMVTAGVAEVLRIDGPGEDNANYETKGVVFTQIGLRRKGNFISADERTFAKRATRATDSTSRDRQHTRFAVRAVEDVSVAVLSAATMQWAVEHDYRLEVELHRTLAARKKVVAALLDAEDRDRGHDPAFSSVPSSPNSTTPLHGPYMSSPRLGPAFYAAFGTSSGSANEGNASFYPRSERLLRGGGEAAKIRRFKVGLDVVLPEFLESGDLGECSVCIGELDAVCGFGKAYLVVKRAVSLALDRGTDRAKEMVAVLLEALGDHHHHDNGDNDDTLRHENDKDVHLDDNVGGKAYGRRCDRSGGANSHNLGLLANDPRAGGGMEKGLALLSIAVAELSVDVPVSASDDIAVYLARAHLVGTVRCSFLHRLRCALIAAKQWILARNRGDNVDDGALLSPRSSTPPSSPPLHVIQMFSTIEDKNDDVQAAAGETLALKSLLAAEIPPPLILDGDDLQQSSSDLTSSHENGIRRSQSKEAACLPACLEFLSPDDVNASIQVIDRALTLVNASQSGSMEGEKSRTGGVMGTWGSGSAGTVGLSQHRISTILDEFAASNWDAPVPRQCEDTEAAESLQIKGGDKRKEEEKLENDGCVVSSASDNISNAVHALWAVRGGVPYFMHEFCFQLTVRAINAMRVFSDHAGLVKPNRPLPNRKHAVWEAPFSTMRIGDEASAFLALLASVVSSGLVSHTQLRLGWLRYAEVEQKQRQEEKKSLLFKTFKHVARARHGLFVGI